MTRPRVALYITDHGFGHATRCVALIRAFMAHSDVEILVRSGSCVPLLAASLAGWTARPPFDSCGAHAEGVRS